MSTDLNLRYGIIRVGASLGAGCPVCGSRTILMGATANEVLVALLAHFQQIHKELVEKGN